MRSYSDASSGKSEIRASMIPTFQAGDFALSLSLDPKQIERAVSPEENTVPFWLDYGASFLESFSWFNKLGTSFVTLDRTTPLSGDPSGLFPGFSHTWDGTRERLSFDSFVSGGIYSHRLFFDDLSFSRWDRSDASMLSGFLMNFDAGRVDIGSGLLADFGYGDNKEITLTPELWLDIPLMTDDILSLRLSLGGAVMFENAQDWKSDDLGWGAWLSFPLKSRKLDLTIGTMWQTGPLWYAKYNEYYKPTEMENALAFYASSNYRDENMDLSLELLWNVDLDNPDNLYNTFLDGSIGFSLGSIDTIIGVRKQNLFSLRDWKENSDVYVGLEVPTGSLTSSLVFRFTNGLPQLGFTSSLALVDREVRMNDRDEKRGMIDVKFDLGFRSIHNEDPEFFLSPILSFGKENMMASFRVPLTLRVGSKVELVSLKGDSWWDMWNDTSTENAIFDSFTDMFVFIDSIELGSEEDMVYLSLSRKERMNDVFFENYKSHDALSAKAGLNFANLKLELWVDDMEAPRIMDPSLSWYPFESDSATFIISAPTEFLMKDWNNMEITSFFGLTFMYPFLGNRLNLSVFAYGELSAVYEDGIPVKTKIIYDFEKDSLAGYLLGGEISWTDELWHLSFSGGINSGLLYPNWWNSFTSLNPDRDRKKLEIDGLSYWLIGEVGLNFNMVDFFMKYSLPDLASLWSEDRELSGDMLTFALDFTLPNGVGMKAKLSCLDLISTISKIVDIESYILSEKTIYALSLTKEFENMSLEAELSAQAYYTKSRDGYMNSYSLEKVAPGLSIKTRIGF